MRRYPATSIMADLAVLYFAAVGFLATVLEVLKWMGW